MLGKANENGSNNERIQEIKEEWCRVEEMYKKHPEYRDVFDQAHPWIGYLLSEVERLQEENKKLQATIEIIGDSAEKYIIDRARTALSHLKG